MSGYVVLSAVTLAVLVFLTVRGERKKADRARIFRTNLIAGCAGGGLLALSLLVLAV